MACHLDCCIRACQAQCTHYGGWILSRRQFQRRTGMFEPLAHSQRSRPRISLFWLQLELIRRRDLYDILKEGYTTVIAFVIECSQCALLCNSMIQRRSQPQISSIASKEDAGCGAQPLFQLNTVQLRSYIKIGNPYATSGSQPFCTEAENTPTCTCFNQSIFHWLSESLNSRALRQVNWVVQGWSKGVSPEIKQLHSNVTNGGTNRRPDEQLDVVATPQMY